MNVAASALQQDSSAGSRGVLASYGDMNPPRRAEDADHLREEIQDLRQRMRASEQDRRDIAVRLTSLETKSVNAGSVVWSGKAMLGAVTLAATVIGGSYLVNGEARQASSKILTLLEERTKAQDKTNSDMREAIQAIQHDMQRELAATETRLRGEIRMSEYAKKQGLPKP